MIEYVVECPDCGGFAGGVLSPVPLELLPAGDLERLVGALAQAHTCPPLAPEGSPS